MVVAVLGTGTMGAPMAENLASAGLDVRVWNRTLDKAREVDDCATCSSPGEAASGADVVVTMLSDGDAVEGAVDGLDFGDAVWLQMSTVGLDATERLMALAGTTPFVDAPVVGTKQPAEKGELTVLASGSREARSRVRPVFDAVAARVVELGEAGEGTRLKLVVNSWLVSMVGALAETIAFSEAIGVDPECFLETIDGGPTGPPYAKLKGSAMVAREFPTAFSLALTRKDAGLVREAAERHGFEPELVKTIERIFDRAIEKGHGDDDMAAAITAYDD
jgi:3-hydroxyisobutyrate dehydrogenase